MAAPLPRGIFHSVITWIATKAPFYALHAGKAIFFFQMHLKYNKILYTATSCKNFREIKSRQGISKHPQIHAHKTLKTI